MSSGSIRQVKENHVLSVHFINIALVLLLPACFSDKEASVKYEEAYLRMVTPAEAGMIREFFETRGLSDNLSPRIKVVTTYQRLFDTDQTITLNITGKEQKFDLSYELTAFILKPDSDKSYLAQLKELFPFFAQNRLATFCAYQNFLRAGSSTLDDLYMYGVPVQTPGRLKDFTSVLLTSDLYWIHDPEDPENHLLKCQRIYRQKIREMATNALRDVQVNASFPGPQKACRPPDPRNRIRSKTLLHSGDSDCTDWFKSLRLPGKEDSLPRCIPESETSGQLGFCSLRAKSAKSIVLFRNKNGSLTTLADNSDFSVVTNPGRVKFFCDETVGAGLIINKTGSWFRYYSASCYNPDW